MINFPLYIPEKREADKRVFYRFVKNEFNNKNYMLCLDIKPTEATLGVLGFNSFKAFETEAELKDFFGLVSNVEKSIEGIMLFNEEGQKFLSLKSCYP